MFNIHHLLFPRLFEMQLPYIYLCVVVLSFVEFLQAIHFSDIQLSKSEHEVVEIGIIGEDKGAEFKLAHERFRRGASPRKVEAVIPEKEPDVTNGVDGVQMITLQRSLDASLGDSISIKPCKPSPGGKCEHPASSTTLIPVKVNITINYTLFNINCQQGETLVYGSPMKNTKWNRGKKAVFGIHGWLDSAQKVFFSPVLLDTAMDIKNAYIESDRPDNIILVNWAVRSDNINYLAAAKDSYYVGILLAKMIAHLKSQSILDYPEVKLVGFSFGAHVAGVAGDYINEKYKVKLPEITGLDPEEPLFEESHVSSKYRLDKGDASFVQIINCNNFVNLLTSRSGTSQISGHVNFFPNGGSEQPGCKEKWKFLDSLCSHLRCGELFASTVRGVVYGGCPCDNVDKFKDATCSTCNCTGPPMGDSTPPTARGDYCMKALPSVQDAKL